MHLPSPLSTNRGKARRRLRAGSRAAGLLLAMAALSLAGASGAAAASPTAPPPVSILTSQGRTSHGATSSSPPPATPRPMPTGPRSSTSHGNVVWFHAAPAGADGRRLPCPDATDGQPVLTWWQGTGLGGLSTAPTTSTTTTTSRSPTVNAGNGLTTDGHEFLITPWNTALILSYTTGTADLTSIGGPPTRP